jgi:RecG-like helicase
MLDDLIPWKKEQIRRYNLLFVLPVRYENTAFLEHFTNSNNQLCIDSNINYYFKLNIVKKFIKNKKLFIVSALGDKVINVIHSEKWQYGMKSGMLLMGKISVQGNTYTCFFPTVCKGSLNLGLTPLYDDLSDDEISTLHNFVLSDENPFREELKKIHMPSSLYEVEEGLLKMLAYEIGCVKEIYMNRYKRDALQVYDLREKVEIASDFHNKSENNNVIISPFKLSKDQLSALEDIKSDLQLPYTGLRLIYGEVGSGKSIIAFLAAQLMYLNGKRTCILCPTKILAEQLYNNFCLWYKEWNVTLCTNDKKFTLGDVIIGTQALLFQDKFEKLGLLIIDEQHRFGVLQRSKIFAKWQVDVLMLTATPIPRTFSMLGNYIKVSYLHKKLPIDTFIVKMEDIYSCWLWANSISKPQRVLWICRSVDRVEKLGDAMILHGKITNKSHIIERFKDEGGLLVCTTVVEVGVDLDVDAIFIEEADYMGLLQLHQLRGRVGRRGKDAICVLICHDTLKLKDFQRANTGMEVSQLDVEKRGSGTITGVSQSGDQSLHFALHLEKNKIVPISETMIPGDFISPPFNFIKNIGI